MSLKEDEIASLLPIVRVWFRATCAVLLLIVIHTRPALSGVPEGTWLLANRVAVQVFECSGQLCGKSFGSCDRVHQPVNPISTTSIPIPYYGSGTFAVSPSFGVAGRRSEPLDRRLALRS